MLIVPRRRVVTSTWTPAQISTALWLDSSDGNTLFAADTGSTLAVPGGVIGRWADKSGNGRDAIQTTAASRPTLSSSVLNGLNVVTFDGVNDALDIITSLFVGIGEFQLHWVFARVGAGTGTDGYKPSLSLIAGNQDRGALHYVKNTNNLGASYPYPVAGGWGNYDLSSGTVYASNQASIMSFIAGSSTWQVLRNGVLEGSGSRGGAIGAEVTGLRLAQQSSPSRFSNIYKAEIVMVLNTSTTTSQLIRQYLSQKTGITTV
jgi:hypothetical protein